MSQPSSCRLVGTVGQECHSDGVINRMWIEGIFAMEGEGGQPATHAASFYEACLLPQDHMHVCVRALVHSTGYVEGQCAYVYEQGERCFVCIISVCVRS